MALNHLSDHNPPQDKIQARPKFSWPTLRKAIEFYEKERLCYLPAGWGRKNPSLNEWEEFETRLPTLAEKADWFHEGKATNIGVLCGGVSGGLVLLCFNDPNGAAEFFSEDRWQNLLEATFITKSVRGHHVWLRSDTPIISQIISKHYNESWLEIRSDGNFTVAPPSLHPDGVLYQAVGVNAIVKPKNLTTYIDERLAQLGLKVRGSEETPREKAKPSDRKRPERSDEFNTLAIEKVLVNCAFVKHCQDDAATLSEPHWWSMTSVLAVFGKPGREKIHELSQPYPRYTEKETEQKIEEALKVANKEIGPHTCAFIEQELGFGCPKDCPAKKLDVKSPAGGAKKLAAQEIHGRYIIWDKKGNAKVNVKGLVDDLMEEFVFKTIYGIVRDDILVYQNGVYAFIGEKVIRQECERRVGAPLMTTHLVNEVRDHIARRTFSDRAKFNTERYIINFENGLFGVNAKVLSPHTPDVLSTLRIPISYDPSARCPKIENFLKDVLREDDIKIILEFFGYALIPDYSIPVVLLLLGDGSNGKTQLLLLLGRFIGRGNYVSVSLQDIENYPFAVANLEGKLLNIQGDLSSKWLEGVGMLKQLSGQDPIYANRKHRDPIGFDNFARLVFASNKPPKIEEDTRAVWRRILPVSMPNKFGGKDGQEEVKNIVNTITTPQELSGLLNLALEGLDRVLTNGDFSYQGTFDDRAKHYTTASDPAKVFVAECCLTGMGFEILKNELYQAYVQFCGENKVQISGEAQFGKELRQVPGLSLTVKQHRDGGEIFRWWVGIKLRPTEIDMEV